MSCSWILSSGIIKRLSSKVMWGIIWEHDRLLIYCNYQWWKKGPDGKGTWRDISTEFWQWL